MYQAAVRSCPRLQLQKDVRDINKWFHWRPLSIFNPLKKQGLGLISSCEMCLLNLLHSRPCSIFFFFVTYLNAIEVLAADRCTSSFPANDLWLVRSASPSRSFHPYVNPEVLSLIVQDGSLAYMRWMDEAVPDDWRQPTSARTLGQAGALDGGSQPESKVLFTCVGALSRVV